MKALHGVVPNAPHREPPGHTAVARSRLRRRLDRELGALAGSRSADQHPTTALRETVEAIWRIVEQVGAERALGGSREDGGALLDRRELVWRGTCALAAVVRRGVAAGAFRPQCEAWAIRHLAFAIVAGACVHWMLGLAQGPSLRASTAVEAALEVVRPDARLGREPRRG